MLLSVCTSIDTAIAQTNRPNIVFFLTEDAGAFNRDRDAWGANTRAGIDRQSWPLFLECSCASSVCSVSKAALLTGLMPHSNNLRTNVENFFPGASGIAAGDIGPNDTSGRLGTMLTRELNADQIE